MASLSSIRKLIKVLTATVQDSAKYQKSKKGLTPAQIKKLKKNKPPPPKKKVRTHEDKVKNMKKDLPPPHGTPEYKQWKRERQNAILRGNYSQ
tara:strand:+ start:918 stop:1196 length:279 start_codon:yes stop_codon:yes gene_type:complete